MLFTRDLSNKIILESIMSPSVSAHRRPGAAEGERVPCTETRSRRARGTKWEIYWGDQAKASHFLIFCLIKRQGV